MLRGLFIGRFQPFHNGHLHAVKHILSEVDEVVIAVASAQYNYTIDNPFTAGERIEMIKLALGPLYNRTYVIPVDNIPNNYTWPRHVLNYVPRVHVVYTNNEFVAKLFKDYGLETRPVPHLEGVSGTLIRKLIVEDKPWKHLVPEPVAKYIEEIGGVERIKLVHRMRVVAEGERHGR
ncbi:MAG: nicotinate-nucleotide adenylyltransferase [Thermoprotei archaeon]|nr:MAG: nicotinate-nucleotide adenylyltransferase [Thermoprotei archaeon]